MHRATSIERRAQDVRFAVRQLRKHPGFTATAIAMLALGLCANVAIFGFVDAALIRPLPYHDPSRLVTAFGTRPEAAPTRTRGMVSYLNFLDWRERTRGFSSMAAYDVREGFILSTSSGPRRVSGLRVTSGFFQTLGVTPALGREFRRDEEGAAAPAAVMLAFGAWQARFGGRPDVLGQTLTLQGEPHVVIGVLPRGFLFPMAAQADFWTTIRGPQPCWEARTCQSLETVARLADGVSMNAALADADAILQQLRSQSADRTSVTAKLVPLRELMLGNVRPILLMLLSGAGLLLLIGCINVMALLLVRSDSRTREIAVRNALGASSAQLLMQFATEASILVTAGTGAGLMLSVWGMQFLASLLTPDMISRMPYLQGIALNARAIWFACAVSCVCMLVFTVTPFVRLSASHRLAGPKEAGRGAAGTSWRRFGGSLVVAELAVAVVLLVGAGLLGKSLYRLLHVETGFNVRQLAILSVNPPAPPAGGGGQSAEEPGRLARDVADRIAALPGVRAVGYADQLPLGPGLAPTSTFWIVGRADEAQLREDHPVRRVSASYFDVLQSTLLRGRFFTDEEVASRRLVMIINETAARRYFQDEDPIGRTIALGGASSTPREIVGVVADIKTGPLEVPVHPAAYVPFDQFGFGVVVRTSQREEAVLQSLAAAAREVRPDLLVSAGTMTDRMNGLPSTSLQRSSAWLVGGFAAMALLMSLVGLYGVVAYSVGQRAREIGVRMALGARRGSVYRLVLGEAVRLVAAGTALGLICAVMSATLLRRLLFDVQSWDVATLVAAGTVLTVSAMLATYVPARRAASVNPIEVLRAE